MHIIKKKLIHAPTKFVIVIQKKITTLKNNENFTRK